MSAATANNNNNRSRGRQTLACILQALEGSKVVVELRRDTILRGVLMVCDGAMNLQMTDVTLQPLQGEAKKLEYLHVRSRQVRYVHLPASVDVSTVVQNARRRGRETRMLARADMAQNAGKIEKGGRYETAID
jgi:small nuclear ribonucleoprotein (snRNP)-like protein